MGKTVYLSFFLISFLFVFSSSCLAQVVINEFSSNTSTEWVELYNTSSDQTLNLDGWRIIDANASTSDDLDLNGCISPLEFRKFSRTEGWLNNTGSDTITLKNNNGDSIDSITYGSGGVVSIPSTQQSAGRDPDGGSIWKIFDMPTPTDITCQNSSSPSPSPTPNPNPSNSSTTSTATYKINEVKDSSGNILSSVQIFVDGNYVHHYAPETLKFCDGCTCDNYANCGFGEHTIKLGKDGYKEWSEKRIINSGSTYEISVVMSAVDLSSPSPSILPSPTSSPSLIASKKPSPFPSNQEEINETSIAGEILGEENSQSAQPVQNNKTTNNKKFLLPLIISFFGMILLVISGYSLIKAKGIKIKS